MWWQEDMNPANGVILNLSMKCPCKSKNFTGAEFFKKKYVFL